MGNLQPRVLVSEEEIRERVVELAATIPSAMKLEGGVTKAFLRNALRGRLGDAAMERPKQGFAAPIGMWLRGPLREWAEALLDEGRLRREGLFRPEPIRQAWLEHLEGPAAGAREIFRRDQRRVARVLDC